MKTRSRVVAAAANRAPLAKKEKDAVLVHAPRHSHIESFHSPVDTLAAAALMASPKKDKRVMRAAPKRPLPLLRRAILHSSLCFFIGLLTGFTPSHWTTTAHIFSALHAVGAIDHATLLFPHYYPAPAHPEPPPLQQPQLLVVVTITDLSDPERRAAGLTRTEHALRLVPAPVLWLVVEPAREAPPTARLLRGAGVVYRHLTYRDNFTDAGVERHHQRNFALGHIEQHRLAGVVLFAGLGDVYDLRFFHQLREIRMFGAWPVATVSEYERKVVVEGPACSGSPWAVTGWFSTVTVTGTAAARSPTMRARPPNMDVCGFAFSSSLLWYPHRWDRFPISEPDASQDSVKFVRRLVVEEYNTSRGMPNPDCSEIMVWRGDQIISLPTST